MENKLTPEQQLDYVFGKVPEAGHVTVISEFLQSIDLITDFAISDKEKIKMIEAEVKKEYQRIGVENVPLIEDKGEVGLSEEAAIAHAMSKKSLGKVLENYDKKEEAIEFAEWILRYYAFSHTDSAWVNLCDLYVEEKLTSAQLYELFKNKNT